MLRPASYRCLSKTWAQRTIAPGNTAQTYAKFSAPLSALMSLYWEGRVGVHRLHPQAVGQKAECSASWRQDPRRLSHMGRTSGEHAIACTEECTPVGIL